MSIGYARDISPEVWTSSIVLDKITVKRDGGGVLTAQGGECLIDRDLFFRISDYTRSQPTAPSPGRIYRKALFWTALYPDQYPNSIHKDPNWFLFLCVETPDSRPKYKKSVDHVPFHATFMDEDHA